MLAKFFSFPFFSQGRLYNKAKRKLLLVEVCGNKAGISERAGKGHLTHSGSQSEHRIRSKLAIAKGYRVRATTIKGQNAFAVKLCFARVSRG